MIEIEEFVSHIDGHSKPLRDSKLLAKAGYLQQVGLVEDCSGYVHVRRVSILVSHPSDICCEMNVKIRKPFPGSVGHAHCNCDGRSSDKCKHSVAFLQTLM